MAVPVQFQWKQLMELGYADGPDSNDDMADPVCFTCGKAPASPQSKSKCGKCQAVTYCSRECQVANWKKGTGGGHKYHCAAYKRVGPDMMMCFPADKETARQDIFQRIRLYACPFYVHRSLVTKSKGFLFIQSDSTLAEMSLPIPKLSNGLAITKPRSILLHFLTIEEYSSELCRDDFELTSVSSELNNSVKEFNEKKEIVVLMRFRCGHAAVGIAPLPDYQLCKTLGAQYYAEAGSSALQLNLDDL